MAVAGAFAAPAFAATSNVDVYGVVNVAIENVDNDVNDKMRVTTGNNSALGVKGSEDLGGGLKAVWQIETNVSVDGDNNATAGSGVGALNGTRNTFVGLAGGFGTVIAGVHDTPYKMSTGKLDSFVATIGDYNTIMGAATGSNASSTFDLRTGNTVAYLSPSFGGFDVKAAYVMSADDDFGTAGIDNSSAWSLSGTYANGPLFLTAAYEKHNLDGGVSATSGGVVLLGNATTASNDRDAWKVGAGYKFGNLGLGAIFERVDVGGTNGDHDNWFVTADYTIGAFKLKAAYSQADETNSGANNGADMWAVGADYSLSKRTTVQLTYASLDNDASANYILGQGTNNVTGNAAGRDADGIALNLVHKF
jgi:predicted porin